MRRLVLLLLVLWPSLALAQLPGEPFRVAAEHPGDAAIYRVYVDGTLMVEALLGAVFSGGSVTMDVPGLPAGPHRLSMTAADDRGESAPAVLDVVVGLPAPPPPPPPPNPTVGAPDFFRASAATYYSVKLDWTDTATTEEGFYLEMSSDGGVNFNRLGSLNANTTSFVVTGLGAQLTYRFRLQAFNALATSPWSAVATIATLPNPVTPPPPHPPAPFPLPTVVVVVKQCTLTITSPTSPDGTTGWGVQYQRNGVNHGSRDTSKPFEKAATVTAGSYTLTAIWTKKNQPTLAQALGVKACQ